MTGARQALGRCGEAGVERWYLGRGYQVVARNWRCPDGELDLIVCRDGTFVFCEVKTRSSTAFGAPVEAVGRAKQVRLRRLAARWLAEAHPGPVRDVRFDVASVLAGRIEVVEGAF